MKIMTYNILDGGDFETNSRIEDIVRVINTQKVDFIAIQEANDFDKDDNALLKKISTLTNFHYYALGTGEIYHVAILSRYPLKDIHHFPDNLFKHAALSVIIDSPLGEISICCVHLHASSENERIIEAKTILEYQSKFEKSIILGDFNAVSQSDLAGADLSAEEFTYYGLTEFAVTNLFNESYTDSALYLGKNNMTTHPTIGIGHPISKTGIRIDYVFINQALVTYLQEIQVIKTPVSEIASDHYPLVVELK